MTNLIRVSLAALLALTAAACGDDTGDGGNGGGSDDGSSDDGSDGTTETTTTGSETFTCCLNGTNYSCPSQAANDACFGGDSSGCTMTGTNPDGTCN